MQKKSVIVELTICFDTLLENVAERKRAAYYDLTEEGYDHQVTLSALEVGSRGVHHVLGFLALRKHLDCTMKSPKYLLVVNVSKKRPSRVLSKCGVPGTGKTTKNSWSQASPSLLPSQCKPSMYVCVSIP